MILVLLTMVMSSWKESTWTYLSNDHTDQIAGEINEVLTWRSITAICQWFVALLNNNTCGEFYICLWQKFCTLEVSSLLVNTKGNNGPLYCGPQLHQCWSTLSRICDSPALSSWSHLQFLVIHTQVLLNPPCSKANDLGWLVGIGRVTAAFATCKIQVPATLSGNSEPLTMVASWNSHFVTQFVMSRLQTQPQCW